MTTIAHISDLHFSLASPAVVSALLRALHSARPSLLAISGDLTQRARTRQFAEAQRFIESAPRPMLMVPGNHDVPMHAFWERFLSPTGRYRRLMCDDLAPEYCDTDLFVLGTNSARAVVPDLRGFWKNGGQSREQLRHITARFGIAPSGMLKVLVMHHPLINPNNDERRDSICRRGRILQTLENAGVDLVLSGHLHHSYTRFAPRVTDRVRPILCVQAGTACSSRLRGEANSFNLIRWDGRDVQVTIYRYDGTNFMPLNTATYTLR